MVRIDPPTVPSLVVGKVSHRRRTPVTHAFEHSHYQWLVDLDALPRLRWPMRLLAGFDDRDHLDGGRLGGGTRGDLERWLSRHGVLLEPEDKVLMLAHARALGHVFNPLTVYWCLRPDRSLKALVLEVHNTYGQRHAYLLDVDARGRAEVGKEFYVSPFNDAHGRYTVAVTLGVDRVRTSVALDRDGERVLTAVASGCPVAAKTRTLLSVFGRHPFMTHKVSLLIRWHGIRLWLARLPVLPRPAHPQEAVR
jgi:DUF1365 family protein